MYADVLLPLSISTPYTYFLPHKVNTSIGCRVLVPVGNKTYIGLVYKIYGTIENTSFKIKNIIETIDEKPIIFAWQLNLWAWIADYYMCSLNDVMVAALPAFLFNQEKINTPSNSPFTPSYENLHTLNENQQQAMLLIEQKWETHNTVLLHGVTSSGKTEIYIHLIAKFLLQGKQVLYLVPEISLTSQLTSRLRNVFAENLLVYHSLITTKQRKQIYSILLNNTPCIILGTRSATFLPFNQLGLIIIDEEHDQSYKQTSPIPHYNARSVAIMLSRFQKIKLLLGSATPSIESYYNAQTNKYALVELKQRYQGILPPKITLVDLKRQYQRKEMYDHFSDPLVYKIQSLLKRKKQIILFQNRRGYAPQITCPNCAMVILCPQCNVPLTLHKNISSAYLECHYCGFKQAEIKTCPQCGHDLKQLGMGTEKIEEEVINLFPTATIKRMDWDTTRKKNATETIISEFANHQIDILLGTQMITQGLDFDNVGLVAILNADNLLAQPTFRNHEYAFQRLMQVAGRSGRKNEQGEVLIQTWMPTNPLFSYLSKHDYLSFYKNQLAERENFKFPPFYRLIQITLTNKKEEQLLNASTFLHNLFSQIFKDNCSSIITPAVDKIKGDFLRQIRIKVKSSSDINKAHSLIANTISYTFNTHKTTRINIDVDPI